MIRLEVMGKNVSRDTPLAEVTLRKYERPGSLADRELARKLCLSLGLLHPGDSRDVIEDILLQLLVSETPLNIAELEKQVILSRKKEGMAANGTASSNIRRQVRRLKGMFIVEKSGKGYKVSDNMCDILDNMISKHYVAAIMERVKEYCGEMDKRFNKIYKDKIQ